MTTPSRPSRRYTPPKTEPVMVFHKSPRPFTGVRAAAREGRARADFASKLSPAGQALLRVMDHQVAAPALEAERVRREARRDKLRPIIAEAAAAGFTVDLEELEAIADKFDGQP